MGVIGLRRGGSALRGDQAEALELTGELAQGFELIAGEDQRSFDRLEGRACGEARAGSGILREGKLLSTRQGDLGLCLRWEVFRRHLRVGMNDVLDGSYAADGFLGEDAKFEREGAGEFAFEIDGAAAHPCDDAGVLYFWPFELDEDDGLPRAKEIGHDADDFEVEFFDLVSSEDSVGVPLHAGANLAEGKDFGGGGRLRLHCGERRGDARGDGKRER